MNYVFINLNDIFPLDALWKVWLSLALVELEEMLIFSKCLVAWHDQFTLLQNLN